MSASGDDDTFITNITKVFTVPEWVKGNVGLRRLGGIGAGGAGILLAFAENPAAFVRGIIFRDLIGGLIDLFTPIIGGVQVLFIGSRLGYSKDDTAIGLADLPLALAVFIFDALTWAIASYIDALLWLAESVIPQTAGPIDGILINAVFAIELVLTARVAVPVFRKLIRALIDAIPVVSGLDELIWG